MSFKYSYPSVLWALFILIMLSIPGSNMNNSLFNIKYIDKIGHLGMFAIFAFFIMWGLHKQYKSRKSRSNYIKWTISIGFFWAIITETVQLTLVRGRSFECLDILADILGVILGITFFYIFFIKKH